MFPFFKHFFDSLQNFKITYEHYKGLKKYQHSILTKTFYKISFDSFFTQLKVNILNPRRIKQRVNITIEEFPRLAQQNIYFRNSIFRFCRFFFESGAFCCTYYFLPF